MTQHLFRLLNNFFHVYPQMSLFIGEVIWTVLTTTEHNTLHITQQHTAHKNHHTAHKTTTHFLDMFSQF